VILWATGSAAIDTTITLARVDGGTDTILENNTLVTATAGQDEYIPSIGARTGTPDVLIAWARVNPTTPLNVSWHYRRFQTSVPPPPPGGGSSTGRDNPNGNQLFNDTLCGDGAAAVSAGPAVWLALAGALLLVGLARH